MAVLPASVSPAPTLDAATVSARTLPRRSTPSRFVPTHTFLFRMVVAAGLTAVAFAPVYAQLLADALAGSRAAYLVVVPVLMAVIVSGYRVPPRGVGDGESDWIVAAVIGVSGFVALHLMNSRIPTLAGLWELRLLGLPLWLGCLAAVMFGLRHAVRMWPLWVFAICAATPLPYLLTVATLGGSDTAAALVAAALGAVAVFLGGRLSSLPWRLGAALGCAAASTAFVMADTGVGLLVTVVIVGAALPITASLLLHVHARVNDVHPPYSYPRLPPVSLAVFAVLSAVMFALHPSAPDQIVTAAHPNWTQRAQLGEPESFDFIARYLGSGATLQRFSAPPVAGLPAAAVDVMSAPDLAALENYSDAVWYPTKRPAEYRPAELHGLAPRTPHGAEVIHTNVATAIDNASQHWYAVTWVWHSDGSYQRVTVVVNQDLDSSRLPPRPVPVSMTNSAIEPALWIARQQAAAEGPVDPQVIRRATDVANLVLASADAGVEEEGVPTGA